MTAALAVAGLVGWQSPAGAASTSGWSGYESLAAGVTGSPSASSWSAGRLDVFWVGPTGSLMQEFYAAGWGGPVNLGGQWIGQPAAVSWSAGRIDVFGEGVGGTLQHVWWDGRRWQGPEVLATGVSSSPTVTTWGAGRLDVFYLDSAGQLVTTYYNGSWHTVANLGGTWMGSPAAVAWSAGRIDVFGQGAGGSLQHLWYSGRWIGPETLRPPGSLTAAPTVASWAAGRLDVFWIDSSGLLQHLFYSGGWSGGENLGGSLTGAPAAVSWGSNRIDVFGEGSDNTLQHTFYDSANIRPINSPLGIVTNNGHTLPVAVAGQPYTYQFTAVGSIGPYHWSMSLPTVGSSNQYSTSSSGLLSVTATQSGTFTFIVAVSTTADPNGYSVSVSLTVQPPAQVVTWQAPMTVDQQPNGSLSSVTCGSPTVCFAVDDAYQTAYEFNGSVWSIAGVPIQRVGQLQCTSATFCLAIGEDDSLGDLYSIFNGANWSTATSASLTVGSAVLACSSSSFCMTLDSRGQAAVFNGASWTSAPTAAAQPLSISCLSASFCMEGTRETVNAAEVFDGTTWQQTNYFAQESMVAVSCASTTSCAGVGGAGVQGIFTGTYWSTSYQGPGNVAPWDSVSCASASFCVATGAYGASTYTGQAWTATDFAGGTVGVSCPTTHFCLSITPNGTAIVGTVAP
jgi:hypothetical protein